MQEWAPCVPAPLLQYVCHAAIYDAVGTSYQSIANTISFARQTPDYTANCTDT
ncbi:hypothetical protein GCM10007391_03590 [Alteromonas halophila]|uniref:Uncharacterized protein n=1 Tax=Alteromonas halophila TaxID=516698 RepID=A0A918MTX0_9ALTE|nr:hypothetical protein GCM10007391_03590 [Alteromonas halophila]